MARKVKAVARLAIAVGLLGTSACGLTEVALVPEADALVAEASFQWWEDRPNQLFVWVHRSLGPASAGPVDAEVELGFADGSSLVLGPGRPPEDCVDSSPEAVTGSCYRFDGGVLEDVQPGDRLTFVVRTSAGEELRGASTVPQAHTLLSAENGGECYMGAFRPIRLGWTLSEGAWAYVIETQIFGLRAALGAQGIEVESDPLSLLGFSVSAQDTTVVFPSEVGLFQRGSLNQDLAVALQQGLPPGTLADVVVTASDRNLVNWTRGGNFNPSGQVRIPSLRGDGTGFFGTSVLRRFTILVPGVIPEAAVLCQPVGSPLS